MKVANVRLDDVAEFTNGGAWSDKEYVEYGIPVARISDFVGGTIDLAACKYLPESSLTRYNRHKLNSGDLVIAMVGSHVVHPKSVVGRAVIVPQSANGSLLNQNAVRIRPKNEELNKSYLGYLGQSHLFRNYIVAHARGAANQVRMSLGLLKEMQIALPPLSIQSRIAEILTAYDGLIENNGRRIRILEEIALRIYEEWFVRFRFPGHESGKMVESELGRIPVGWSVVSFTDIADVLSGGTPKTTEPAFWDGDIPFFTPKDIGPSFFVIQTEKQITELGLKKCNSSLYDGKTIFITARGTVGKVTLPGVPMAMNQSCYALKGKDGTNHHFLFMATMDLTTHLKKKASGATFDAIVVDTFRSQQTIKPPSVLTDKFSETVQPMFSEMFNLLKRNQVLRITRDVLLPKLLLGEIDVSNFPEPVSD